MSVMIETSLGDVVIDLFVDKCKNACTNFIKLCKQKFYNGACVVELHKHHVCKLSTPGKPQTSIFE